MSYREAVHRITLLRHSRKLSWELYEVLLGVGMLGTQLVLGSWSRVDGKMNKAKYKDFQEENSFHCSLVPRDLSLS